MVRKSKYTRTEEACVTDAIEGAMGTLEDLASEVREVVDNASEGLSQTQRIQTLDETASTLEGLAIFDIHEECSEIRCSWTENVHPRASRRDRRDNATAALSSAVDAMEQRISDLQEEIEDHEEGNPAIEQKETIVSELESLRDDVQSIIDEADSCEFPGMYG